jgi:hypothetical protein
VRHVQDLLLDLAAIISGSIDANAPSPHEAEDAERDEVNRDNEVQQPRHEQDQDPGDQGDDWLK